MHVPINLAIITILTHPESLCFAVGNVQELHYLLPCPIGGESSSTEPAQIRNRCGKYLWLLTILTLLLVGLLFLHFLGLWTLIFLDTKVLISRSGLLLLLPIGVLLCQALCRKNGKKDDCQEQYNSTKPRHYIISIRCCG